MTVGCRVHTSAGRDPDCLSLPPTGPLTSTLSVAAVGTEFRPDQKASRVECDPSVNARRPPACLSLSVSPGCTPRPTNFECACAQHRAEHASRDMLRFELLTAFKSPFVNWTATEAACLRTRTLASSNSANPALTLSCKVELALPFSSSSAGQPRAAMSGRGKGKTAGKKSVSRSAKAGLQFPVGRIAR